LIDRDITLACAPLPRAHKVSDKPWALEKSLASSADWWDNGNHGQVQVQAMPYNFFHGFSNDT